MSNRSLKFEQTFNVNTVVWITSLPEDEIGPSNRMKEDLAILSIDGRFAFEAVAVGSRAELLSFLTQVAERCANGLRPILHFDCHGSAESGLLLAPSGDFLAWVNLAEALREVNVAAENNVACIFGVCFGIFLSMELSLSEPTPYFLTIAPEKEIAVGELQERLAPFYARLFETGNITQAYRDKLAPSLSVFYSTEVFAKAFATYIANHASGHAARSRKEAVISGALKAKGITTPTNGQLRSLRRLVKDGLRPSQAQFTHFAKRFLIGRSPGFTLAEVLELAEHFRKRRNAVNRVDQCVGGNHLMP